MKKSTEAAIKKLQAAAAALSPGLLDAICREADESTARFEVARENYVGDYEERQNGVESGISNRSNRLLLIEERKASLTDKIGTAYSTQQIEEAHKLEEELERLSVEEYGVREALNHVNTVKVQGDLSLFSKLYVSYQKKRVADSEAAQDLEMLRAELRKLFSILDSYENNIRIRAKQYSGVAGTPESQMVEAAERIIGPLDLSGGMEGFNNRENAAKIAIICHSSKSKAPSGKLKDSPAFLKWISLLEKIENQG